ncbi:MAG: site-specific integrase [Bacteroidota bacterium]
MKKATYNYEKSPFTLQLESLTSWMKKEGYAQDTIRMYSNYAGCFLEWLEGEQIAVTKASYTDLMEFIKHYQKQDSTGLLNRKLGAIRKYYEWLQFEGEIEKNPASGIYLKGRKRSVPHDLLDRETLGQLYENYHVTDERTQRNKVILGLLIYQGLTTEELHKLEPEHVKLKVGKIAIPAGGKTQSRTLKLQPNQILELQEYIKITRPHILAKVLAYDRKRPFYRAGRKVTEIDKAQLQRQLLISSNGSVHLKNTLKYLIRALQGINEEVKSAAQLRQSVITEWLKVKELRTVQYMAGHRYVSTTERYQSNNLEDLEEALNVHHPLEQR